LEVAVAGLHGNAAAFWQSVAGIENQVQENLLGLRLIDLNQT
jgi:hypothetical protein